MFAANDQMALGALRALAEAGRDVPREISVVGFDDVELARFTEPPLTTVRWPIRTMARSAAMKLIHPEAAADEKSLFLTEFVPRASVAKV